MPLMYLLFLFFAFSSPALACQESQEKKEERFKVMDTDENGKISYKEFIAGKDYDDTHKQRIYDTIFKESDGEISKKRFLEISFVRGCE